jgi:hypothetical protein
MTWGDLQVITWPSGQPILTVQSAVEQVQHEVAMLILDIKTSDDVSRVSSSPLNGPLLLHHVLSRNAERSRACQGETPHIGCPTC